MAKEIRAAIAEVVAGFGVDPTCKGYDYLVDAIELVVEKQGAASNND